MVWQTNGGAPEVGPVSSEISDFTPDTHAQSNILHTKYVDKTDHYGLGLLCACDHDVKSEISLDTGVPESTPK